MSQLEEYTAKAAESLAAVESATTERERMFHRRAHSVWRKLILGLGEAEERRLLKPEGKIKPLKEAPAIR